MLIVGTAGHIDHGKTTLIHALTGMDTDRLAEEKRRGISIDLGFAHMVSPDGRQISFIDVPGHERFIKNMLAGVGGIDAVLLVVAADEGVKPQTREHFEICRLLQIPTGLVALTKTDHASSDQITATRSSVAALIRDSFLQNAPVLEVSARTGEGVAALRSALSALVVRTTKNLEDRLARLNIDRSFAAKGFGTVVTGTLLQGTLAIGDTVRLHPINKTAKIRSLQVHGQPVAKAMQGERTAINLAGIEYTDLRRGLVLTHENELGPTSLVDISLEWLSGEPVPTKREQYLLHAGTAELPVDLKVTGPGRARLWLSMPTLLLPDDRLILRRPSPAATVAGGKVLDAFPPVRLNRVRTNARLAILESEAWAQRIQTLVEESASGQHLSHLVKRTGLSVAVLKRHIAENQKLLLVDGAQRVLSMAWLEGSRAKLLGWLGDYHAKNPSAPGAPIAQARLNLEPAIAAVVFANFPPVRITGDLVALATHKPQISSEHSKLLKQIEQGFREAGFQPPTPAMILQQAGTDMIKGRPFLEALIKAHCLIRVSEEIVFHADVIATIRRSLGAKRGSRFSIPEFKEWTKVSRKYAVPLLEYLDRQHVTRREGDARVIL